jgi:hypothetical protein
MARPPALELFSAPCRRPLLGRVAHPTRQSGRVRAVRCDDCPVADDRNRLAVYERVLRGLRACDVLAHPPKDDRELGDLAERIADDLASGIELSHGAKRSADSDPAAVTFVTTEHFTLQGARSSTISESTGRASVFLGAVSGGLIALGLVATATKTGVAFYTFGLILLPTLAFVGLATFHRVLQTGIEDLAYARRIAQLRGYYFDHAPEVAKYLPNPAESLPTPGLGIRLWQQFVTVAGMVAVITAVLNGSAGGLLADVASGHSRVAALVAGVVVGAAALTGLMRHQNSAWIRGTSASLLPVAEAGPD